MNDPSDVFTVGNHITVARSRIHQISVCVFLPSYLSVYLSVFQSIYLAVQLSSYISVSLSAYLSIYWFVCVPIYRSVHLTSYMSVSLSGCLSAFRPFFPSVFRDGIRTHMGTLNLTVPIMSYNISMTNYHHSIHALSHTHISASL